MICDTDFVDCVMSYTDTNAAFVLHLVAMMHTHAFTV